MQLLVGNEAPDFTAQAVMPDNNIEPNFNLKQYAHNNKCVVFFYPLDFTFVCPTEILALNNRLSDFSAKYTKVVLVSVDSHYSHLAWKNTPVNKAGIGNIQIPMISDLNKNISKAYSVLNPEGVSMRGVFLIDQQFIIRHMLINDLFIGRSIEELLRVIDALDYHMEYGEVCPAGWSKGKEAITPSQKGVADYLISNVDKI